MRRRVRALAGPATAVALAVASTALAPAAGGPLLAAPAALTASRAPAATRLPASAALVRPSPVGLITPQAPQPPNPGQSVDAAPGQPSGTTTLISTAAGGGPANGVSQAPAISSGGRYIAFQSQATNLTGGTSPGGTAIFLEDRSAHTTVQLPLANGLHDGGMATAPSISSDGSTVAFMYLSPDQSSSILVWDRASGQTQRVSLPGDPAEADRSRDPSISADGRYVAFTSDDVSLVANDFNGAQDVFRFDRQTRTTDIVSDGLDGTGSGYSPSISGDGSLVAFVSDAGGKIVAGDPGTGAQVFLRDMNARTTQEVSVGAGGAPPNGISAQPSISDTGQYVAFASQATNLISGVTPSIVETYRRDLSAGQTVLVSALSNGAPSPSAATSPGISRDGRMVAYLQAGSILAVAVSERLADIVVLRDVTAGATAVISVNPAGQVSPSYNRGPRVAGAGRYVVWASSAADLVPGDTNQLADVFLRDMPPAAAVKPSTVDFGSRAVGVAPTYLAALVSNAGWGPMSPKASTIGGANAGDFAVLTDGCSGQALYRGDTCTITVAFAPTQPGARTGRLQVPSNAPGSPLAARLKGLGSQSRIVLDPPVGQQGIVVVATGSGFPPGAQVQLAWSVGITPTLPTVTADAKGRWSLQVLVFHHDIVGPRNLVATWVGGPEFPSLQVQMLVTVRSMTPPDVLGGGAGPVTLLFRG